MKKEVEYEIWSEGFIATGEYGTATYHGTMAGVSFKQACAKLFKNNKTYDKKRNTLWGCRLFNNEAAARKLCG